MAVTAAIARHQTAPHTRGGFLLVPAEVTRRADLSDGAFRTYCAVRSYCFGRKTYCWPSIRTLARDRDCSEETIRRHLRELVEAGLITIKKRGRHNVYHFPDSLADRGEVEAGMGSGSRRPAAGTPFEAPGAAEPSRLGTTPLRDDTEPAAKPHNPEPQENIQGENQPTTLPVGDSITHEELQHNCSHLLIHRGVSPRIARRLVAQHGDALCRQAIELLDHYQRNGAPIRNPGGWLYSAITQGFLKPRDCEPDPPVNNRPAVGSVLCTTAVDSKDRPARSPVDPSAGCLEELRQRRRAALTQRGIPEESEDLWQRVLDYLRARGETAPVLAAAFLRPLGQGKHAVQCPAKTLMPRLRELLPSIRAALVQITGQPALEVGILE